MTTIRERLLEQHGDKDLILADGFDAAVLGVVHRCGEEPIVIYDRDACINILVNQGMSEHDAIEHFEFNVVGAWVGPRTPGFLVRLDGDDA